ncbi:MAG: YicC family protein [Planctomycetes bacterium]|nr:YicC family protein [Planctomycetota bacterium]
MTGYGSVRVDRPGFAAEIELRSVNNRYLKILAKLADELAPYQALMEEAIRSRVARGSVFLNVYFERKRASDLYEIDGEVVRKYLRQIRRLEKDLHSRAASDVRDILTLPGVARARESALVRSKEIGDALASGVQKAAARLDATRIREGRAIAASLRRSAKKVEGLLRMVRRKAPEVPRRYRDRLEERLGQLLPGGVPPVEKADLLREMAIYADRADITEEIERLSAHLEAFEETLTRGGVIGRELDFLLQEMFREANTMAVKCSSLDLAPIIVAMKSEVDRLKEQVQNVE